jgi:predicted lipase
MLSDLMALDIQDVHKDAKDRALGSVYVLASMAACKEAFTMLEDGKVLACCGHSDGELWAFLGKDLKRSMLALTRYGLERIKEFGPVRAWIDVTNRNAIRWAKLAGFRPIEFGYWIND